MPVCMARGFPILFSYWGLREETISWISLAALIARIGSSSWVLEAPKRGHNGITDELLDKAVVSGDYLGNLPEDLPHDLFHFLRGPSSPTWRYNRTYLRASHGSCRLKTLRLEQPVSIR